MSDSWMSESEDDLDEAGPADGGAGLYTVQPSLTNALMQPTPPSQVCLFFLTSLLQTLASLFIRKIKIEDVDQIKDVDVRVQT